MAKISTSLGIYDAFVAAAQSPPDFAGMWIDQQSPVGDPGRAVVTVAYTADLQRHRAELTSIWRGPLGVVQQPRSLAALRQIQAELPAVGQQLGLNILSTDIDTVRNKVE